MTIKVIWYWSRWGNLCLPMLLQRTILGKLSGINTQTVWGLCFTPSLSHPNNRNVYIRLYTKHALWPSIESDIWMSTSELFFVFIWHIDMYLPFCVSIFCCYHACIAWLYQNSLTPLAMYCECFPGQSWGVMTCGDFIKFIYSCDKIYEIYRYVYNNYHSNSGDTNVYKHCALLLLSMLTFIFFLFICNNRRACYEFCAFASDHINMWMLKINKDNIRLCSVYHKFHESSLRGIGCSFRQ